MSSYNKVILMGNITRDIELKYTPSGMAVARLGMAVNRKWRDQATNEMREEVTFVDVDVFGKQAETAQQYLLKGKPLFVEGRLKLDFWDDKTTGKKQYKLKVVCERFQFLGDGKAAASAQSVDRPTGTVQPLQQRPTSKSSDPKQNPETEFDLDMSENQVPF